MIEVRDLNVSFAKKGVAAQVVNSVSFSVARGASIGIVGESGSGKSTILRCLAGIEKSWTGTIEIAGRPLNADKAQPGPSEAQMVFQDPYGSLHPRHTIDFTLREPLRCNGMDSAPHNVAEMLAKVGLDAQLATRYPNQLSGGQRQRVAIARALMTGKPILLLDEPTSALDVTVQKEILLLLAELRSKMSLTLVMVSHDLPAVAQIADQILVMKNGSIVDDFLLSTMDIPNRHSYTIQLLQASAAS